MRSVVGVATAKEVLSAELATSEALEGMEGGVSGIVDSERKDMIYR